MRVSPNGVGFESQEVFRLWRSHIECAKEAHADGRMRQELYFGKSDYQRSYPQVYAECHPGHVPAPQEVLRW